jgi:hypothetical protein
MESDPSSNAQENAAQRLMLDKRQPINIRQSAAIYQTQKAVDKSKTFKIEIFYSDKFVQNKEVATNIQDFLSKRLPDYNIETTPKNHTWFGHRGRNGADIAFSDNIEKKVAIAVATLINTSLDKSLKMQLKQVRTKTPNYLSISIVNATPEPKLSGDSAQVISSINNP